MADSSPSPPPSPLTAARIKTLPDLLSHDMVDVYVGPSSTRWVLHAKLLSARSSFFTKVLYGPEKKGKPRTSSYGLPDEEEEPFRLFVAWLYGGAVPPPPEEKDVATLLELALMADRWDVVGLQESVVDALRVFYAMEDTWPGLRRVQYVCGESLEGSAIRVFMVSCVARMVVCGKGDLQVHWAKALRANATLAVEVLLCLRAWGLDPDSVPDPRKEGWAAKVELKEAQAGDKEKGEDKKAAGDKQKGEVKKAAGGQETNEEALAEMANGLSVGDIGQVKSGETKA